MTSTLSHLECGKCATHYDADIVQQLCTCGGPLLARYDLERARATFRRAALSEREPTMWRYGELLPVRNPARRVSLHEPITPMLELARLGPQLGFNALRVKDEGALPTGSFKARGAAVGISRARELGVTRFAMPTNGNAGGAWSLYAARAGIEACVVMPRTAPPLNRLECVMAGARVYLVDGLINDAGRIVGKAVASQGFFDASTLKEPYRIEGKKTMGFELVEQYGWEIPDVVIYPTGGGVGIIGIAKALRELHEMKLIADRLPRFVAVQASGCAPIVRAWEAGKRESVAWENGATVAFGINVPKALGDFLVLDALYASGGKAVAVEDADILAMQRRIASAEGIFMCPEGAATAVAAAELRASGWISPDERVLLLNTAVGVKYQDVPCPDLPVLARDAALPAA